jgi:hypothetical protein
MRTLGLPLRAAGLEVSMTFDCAASSPEVCERFALRGLSPRRAQEAALLAETMLRRPRDSLSKSKNPTFQRGGFATNGGWNISVIR